MPYYYYGDNTDDKSKIMNMVSNLKAGDVVKFRNVNWTEGAYAQGPVSVTASNRKYVAGNDLGTQAVCGVLAEFEVVDQTHQLSGSKNINLTLETYDYRTGAGLAVFSTNLSGMGRVALEIRTPFWDKLGGKKKLKISILEQGD